MAKERRTGVGRISQKYEVQCKIQCTMSKSYRYCISGSGSEVELLRPSRLVVSEREYAEVRKVSRIIRGNSVQQMQIFV